MYIFVNALNICIGQKKKKEKSHIQGNFKWGIFLQIIKDGPTRRSLVIQIRYKRTYGADRVILLVR